MRSPIYLDHAASTPLNPAARAAIQRYLDEGRAGHASSVHSAGREAEAHVSRARSQIARLIEARPHELVFTGSGTEANNLALKGTAEALRAAGRGDHVITSAIEHESVLGPCEALERRGFRVSRIPVDASGILDREAFERALATGAILVSAMLVNHETGVRLPIREMAERAHAVGALMHTDASLAPGRVPCIASELNVDLMTLSGHKFGGPQGIGALYIRRGLKLEAQIEGGHHERKRRAGSENVLAIIGMGAAAEVQLEQTAQSASGLAELTGRLWLGIRNSIPDVHLNSPDLSSGILSVAFAGVEGESILMNLDLSGIFVSSGAPCSSGSLEPSPVLLAMGLNEAHARSSVRFSLGSASTPVEVERALAVLPDTVARLRALSSSARAR